MAARARNVAAGDGHVGNQLAGDRPVFRRQNIIIARSMRPLATAEIAADFARFWLAICASMA